MRRDEPRLDDRRLDKKRRAVPTKGDMKRQDKTKRE